MTPDAEQLALVPLYRLRYDRDDIMNLQPVANYALLRYPGRVTWQGTALCMAVDAVERRRILRYLRDHSLRHFLIFDDGKKGDQSWAVNTTDGATGATPTSDSSVTTTESTQTPDTTTAESTLSALTAESERT